MDTQYELVIKKKKTNFMLLKRIYRLFFNVIMCILDCFYASYCAQVKSTYNQ